MTKYIIKRILIAIPVLLGITVIDYAIMCMAGSPLEMPQGPRVSEVAVQAKAIALGLDKPFYVQYFVWLGQLLHGNMGYSIKNYQPVLCYDHESSWTDPASDGSVTACQHPACGSGRDLQRNPSVFERRLYGGNIIVPWRQYSGIFLAMLLIYLFTVKLGWCLPEE